jgi:hypothetical protein
MVMDMLRSAYTVTMKLLNGDDHSPVAVRWFRADPGARFFPGPTPFRSLNWEDPKQIRELGEQSLARPWVVGENSEGYRGRNFCGDLQAWHTGGVSGVDPDITTDAEGRCPDCLVALALGGGGGVAATPAPPAQPLALIGGASGHSLTIPVPGGAGDAGGRLFWVAFDVNTFSPADRILPPAGWTPGLVYRNPPSGLPVMTWWHLSTGSEPSAYVWTAPDHSGAFVDYCIVRFDSVAAAPAREGVLFNPAGPYDGPTLSGVGPDRVGLVALFCDAAPNAPTGWTLFASGHGVNCGNIDAAYRILGAAETMNPSWDSTGSAGVAVGVLVPPS